MRNRDLGILGEALQQIFTEKLGATFAKAGIRVQPKTFEIINSL